MQYSDDDVSVSGSEDDHQHDGVSDEGLDDDEDVSFSEGSEDAEALDPTADPAAAAAAAAAGGLAAAGKASTRDVTDALMSSEMSTHTALLQMEVNGHSHTCRSTATCLSWLALKS